MPNITLPDGSTREYENSVTVMEVAESIGPGLAKAALAGRVDGELVDSSTLISTDADLAIITERDSDGLESHSPLLRASNGSGRAASLSKSSSYHRTSS